MKLRKLIIGICICLCYINTFGQNCKTKIDFSKKSIFSFIYQNDSDSLDYYIQILNIEDSLIYVTSFNIVMPDTFNNILPFLKKNHFKIVEYKDSLFQIKRDTIIYASCDNLFYKSKESFINTNAPLYNEKKSDFLNHQLFVLKDSLDDNCRYIEFKQIDIFSSKPQISYTYLYGFWIISYIDPNNTYNLYKYWEW